MSELVAEPIVVFELKQPLCSRVFGTSPCDSVAPNKCFNTIRTCTFLSAIDMSSTLSIFFVGTGANEPTETGYDPSRAIPTLKSVSIAPTVLNVASGDKNFSPLGSRAVANIVISDQRYNDAGIDPYAEDRTYDIESQGTQWGRWLARNPYHVGFECCIYEGHRGQTLAEMTKRTYFIDKIDYDGKQVRIVAKDLLRLVTDTGIKIPAASPGVLSADILAGATSFEVAGAGLTDYAAPGRVRINDEVIAYTTVTELGSGNLEFTGLTRGDLSTTAADHGQNDGVQWVLSYENEYAHDILYDMLVNHTGADASYIDYSAWETESLRWRPLYIFSRHITEPLDGDAALGGVVQQAQMHLWWDERVPSLNLMAHPPNYNPRTLNDEGHLVAESISVTEDASNRASTVNVYYGLRTPTADPTKKASYRTCETVINAESIFNHGGENAVKDILAPWIDASALARSLATSYSDRFKDARRITKFRLTHKDVGDFWTGSVASLRHGHDQNFYGVGRLGSWLIKSAQPIKEGELYEFEAEDNESAGMLWEWADAATVSPDWWSATEDERASVGYWCDADGKDPDGNDSPFRWL